MMGSWVVAHTRLCVGILCKRERHRENVGSMTYLRNRNRFNFHLPISNDNSPALPGVRG